MDRNVSAKLEHAKLLIVLLLDFRLRLSDGMPSVMAMTYNHLHVDVNFPTLCEVVCNECLA